MRSRCLRGIPYIHKFMYSTRLLILLPFFVRIKHVSTCIRHIYMRGVCCAFIVSSRACFQFSCLQSHSDRAPHSFIVNAHRKSTKYHNNSSKQMNRSHTKGFLPTLILHLMPLMQQNASNLITFSRNYFQFNVIAFLYTHTHTRPS